MNGKCELFVSAIFRDYKKQTVTWKFVNVGEQEMFGRVTSEYTHSHKANVKIEDNVHSCSGPSWVEVKLASWLELNQI